MMLPIQKNSILHSFTFNCLANYFILFYLYINVNFGVVHSTKFSDLPRVNDLYKECTLEHLEDKDCRLNPRASKKKAWHVVVTMGLTKEYDSKSDITMYQCLDWCEEKPDCIAVYYQGNNNSCSAHKKGYFVTSKPGDMSQISFMLKCCDLKILKDKPITNYPHLPIIVKPNEHCRPQEDTNTDTCKYKAFEFMEKAAMRNKDYKTILVSNTFECMQECLKDHKCKAYRLHFYPVYVIYCYLYTSAEMDGVLYTYHYSYKLICCNIKDESLWKGKKADLLMLYQPQSVCLSISDNGRHDCNVPFWHIQDDIKFHGNMIGFDGTFTPLLTHLLELCFRVEERHCNVAHVDWQNMKLTTFLVNWHYNTSYGQKKFTSFTLKCCKGFK